MDEKALLKQKGGMFIPTWMIVAVLLIAVAAIAGAVLFMTNPGQPGPATQTGGGSPQAGPANLVTTSPTQKQGTITFDQFVASYSTPEQVTEYMKNNFVLNESVQDNGRPVYAPNTLLSKNGQGDGADFAKFFGEFLKKKGGCKSWTGIKLIYFHSTPYDKSKPQDLADLYNKHMAIFYHNVADGNNYYAYMRPPFPIYNIGGATDNDAPEIGSQKLNSLLKEDSITIGDDFCR
jgi:hypothetical protein